MIFNRNVTQCVYQATIGTLDVGTPAAGEIGVARRAGAPNGVWVQTRDSTGTNTDQHFHLSVTC